MKEQLNRKKIFSLSPAQKKREPLAKQRLVYVHARVRKPYIFRERSPRKGNGGSDKQNESAKTACERPLVIPVVSKHKTTSKETGMEENGRGPGNFVRAKQNILAFLFFQPTVPVQRRHESLCEVLTASRVLVRSGKLSKRLRFDSPPTIPCIPAASRSHTPSRERSPPAVGLLAWPVARGEFLQPAQQALRSDAQSHRFPARLVLCLVNRP